MCFSAKISVKQRIANRDIHVQKVFCRNKLGKILSPFYLTEWEMGETKQAKIEPTFYEHQGVLEIHEGLHSAQKIKLYTSMCGDWYCTNKGASTWICDDNGGMIVCDCIIPKGSIYYKNSDNEYVSNCLKLVKEIECEVINN